MENEIKIVDVKIPFWSLFSIMFKVAIATIPLFITIFLLTTLCIALFMPLTQVMKG